MSIKGMADKEQTDKHLHTSNSLQRNESQYKSLFVDNHSVMLLIDPETGEIKDANTAACQFYGWSNEELLEKKISQINVLSEEEVKAEMLKAKAERRNHFIFKHRLANDEIRDVEVYSDPISIGNSTLLYSLVHDITERKLTEEKLRQSEEKFRSIFETMLDAYYEASLDGQIIDISPSIELISKGQYTRDDLIGKPIDEVYFDFADRDAFFLEIKKYGTVTDYELPLKNKDGSLIHVAISSALIHDKEGNPLKIAGTMRDITGRKQSESRLKESELQYRDLANSGQALIWTATPDKKCDYFNQIWLEFTGRTIEQELGDGWAEGVHPDDLDRCFTIFSTSFDERKSFSMDYRLRYHDGTYRWLQDDGKPRYNGEGDFIGYIGHCLDISERVRAESILNARMRLAEFAQFHTRHELQKKLLDELELLTDSKVGFFHAVDSDQKALTLQSYSTHTLETMCTAESESQHYGIDKAGVWVDCVLQRKAIIRNDYMSLEHRQGLPEGHVPVIRELVVPVFRSEQIVAVVGIGNKTTDYTEVDVETVNLLADLSWDIIERLGTQENMEKLSQAIAQSPVMTYITGTSGVIEYANPKVIEITGYSLDEVLGQNPRIFSSGKTSQEEYQILWKTINAGKEWKGEFHNKKKNGEFYWVSASISPVIDAGENITHYLSVEEDITQRKESERQILELNATLEQRVEERTIQLKEALSRLNKIADRVPGMVYQYQLRPDGTSCFPFASEGIKDIYRVSPQEVIDDATPVFSNLHPDDFDGVAESIQTSANNLKLWQHDYRVKFKDGTIRWLSGSAMPQRKADGAVLWHGFITDITEHKQVEEELALEKQQLVSILEGTNVGTWEWNVQTGETVFNERWADILGYTLEEISPVSIETWMKFAHPDDLKVSVELLDKHFRGESDYYSFESRMKHKNGEWVWVLDRGKVHEWDEEGKPLLMSGTHQDITERKLAEEELVWNRSLLELMSNSSPLAFLVVDNRTDEILYFNHRFCQIWEIEHIEAQMQRGEFKNNDIIPYCLPVLADIPAFAESCKPLQHENNRIEIEDEIAFTEGRTIRRFSTQIRGDNDEYYGRFYIFENITNRKQKEEELRKAKNEADLANQAKSDFLSRMSHELRTPMNSILGFAQIMDMVESNPSNKKRLGHILNSGNHLLKLINEVLDIAGIESGKRDLMTEPILLKEIINDTFTIVQVLAKEKMVSVALVDSPTNSLLVLADPLRLKQVLLNLVSNAIKYNREGGSVSIKTSLRKSKASGNSRLRISVIDTGIGIKPENIQKLFQPFERLDANETEAEGTGLGLMLVKKFMEAMGQVGVKSVYGKGSTFWIELPCTTNISNSKNKKNDLHTADILHPEKKNIVLYIEDNLANVELVKEILLNLRPNTQMITSIYGGDTLRLALQFMPNFILLDLDLPDIKGEKVLQDLLANPVAKQIPVIMLSADAMPTQIDKLLKLGAAKYLTKPLDVPNFLSIIDYYGTAKA